MTSSRKRCKKIQGKQFWFVISIFPYLRCLLTVFILFLFLTVHSQSNGGFRRIKFHLLDKARYCNVIFLLSCFPITPLSCFPVRCRKYFLITITITRYIEETNVIFCFCSLWFLTCQSIGYNNEFVVISHYPYDSQPERCHQMFVHLSHSLSFEQFPIAL